MNAFDRVSGLVSGLLWFTLLWLLAVPAAAEQIVTEPSSVEQLTENQRVEKECRPTGLDAVGEKEVFWGDMHVHTGQMRIRKGEDRL